MISVAINSGFIINDQFVEAPEGILVHNFKFHSEPTFSSKPRTAKLQHFVLHETAGRSADRCKASLIAKGYGVHLILERNGIVSCHGDLATSVMVHAGQLNKTSIGIEVVNPYAPSLANGMMFSTIPAEWWTWCPDKKKKEYVLPTEAQLKVLTVLVPWLCEKLGIPYVFPTANLNSKARKITGWKGPPLGWYAKPDPGVVAHQDFAAHADGRFLLEYLMKH